MKKNIVLFFLASFLFSSEIADSIKAYDKREYKKALTGFEKVCKDGNLIGCFYAGVIYEGVINGVILENYGLLSTIAKDENKAFEMFKKACDGEIGAACDKVGVSYELGRWVKQDFKQASLFYKKACDYDFSASCTSLARLYLNNKVLDNNNKAVELLHKSCEKSDYDACFLLGELYEQGKIVKKDPIKALELYLEVCTYTQDSCDRLVNIYKNNPQEKENFEKVFLSYAEICKKDSSSNLCWKSTYLCIYELYCPRPAHIF